MSISSAVDSGSLQLTSLQVTGMFVHPRKVGNAAAAALVELVGSSAAAGRTISVPVRLNPRASTARQAGRRTGVAGAGPPRLTQRAGSWVGGTDARRPLAGRPGPVGGDLTRNRTAVRCRPRRPGAA
ncbi:hypothetical protein [Pseudonocardia aurantiaca]|uniref:Transcriptional regulator LacI/GalR-like sensor domain-containing protein n=1 Tax=Pseudonocardia aurantiaca TaxID=75290 RepID=A0ABW4FUX9_9PSEU